MIHTCTYLLVDIKGLCLYERLAPTNVGAVQGPSFVTILWTDLVAGSIQAASRVLRVVKSGNEYSELACNDKLKTHTWLNSLEDFLLRVQLG